MFERLLALAATSPFGLMTLSAAAKVGISRFAMADAARQRILERMAPGLYRLAGTPATRRQLLAVPQVYLDGLRGWNARPVQPAALTGLSALEARGIDVSGEGDGWETPVVAIHHERRVRLRTPPFEVVRCWWDPVQVTEVRSLRVVDPGHALADHADRVATDVAARTAVDLARNRLFLEVPDLVERWEELGSRGAQRLLRIEAAGDLECESEGERAAMKALFVDRGPLPDCQVVVLNSFRADFVFISAGLIVEYFGTEAHRDRFVADATRLLALQAAGYMVILVVAPMLREADELSAFIHRERRSRERLITAGAISRPPLPPQPHRRRPLRTLPLT